MRETERKYELDEGAQLPDWSDVPGVHRTTEPEEHLLEAVYFDTAGLDLAAAGITLRRRRGGADRGWHLKLPAGPDSRDEIRVGFTRGEARRTNPTPPAQLVALARAFTRGRELLAVAELTTVRRQWRLTDDEGRDLVEVVDDRVTARALGDTIESSTWREAEVELAEHGDAALLDQLERRLREAGVRRSKAPSKLARVLGGRIPAAARPPRLRGRSTLGEVALAYLHEQGTAIRTRDPAVRRELPDAVHQMRVATRRMRSVLHAYGRVVDRDRTRELAGELKWLAAVLGAARDLEVLEARITDALDGVPDELVLGPVRAHLTRYFTGRRAAAHDELVAALDGERYLALLAAVDTLLADPPLTRAAAEPAREHLGRLIRRNHRRVADHVRTAEGLPLGPERDVELHEARKAAKRLRYATEAAEPVLGKRARTLISRTKDVQELLGDHQDAIVALPVLRELGAQAHGEGANGFTFGLLHEREHSHLPDGALGEAWTRLDDAVRAAAAT
ncbi:CYTH and CHAD domain-containing protein [Pseudonocardia humida]|uniref:CYTH and CHAD domain-containing protein n=1 Tax=Pseudonocardia humida TaxID=2800819 RepID=A0ABT0ZXT3_9PSEU|nr:CYTH and CHAD domain-containing protein [Pseudonocardia humida]MCO1655531.1 CYTH and CHAD domain-containing protein [Pseudonocardia humida]